MPASSFDQFTSSFDQFSGTEKYIVSPELRQAVNVSIALQRPLLVKGEPGTGKTLLAHNLAQSYASRTVEPYHDSPRTPALPNVRTDTRRLRARYATSGAPGRLIRR